MNREKVEIKQLEAAVARLEKRALLIERR